MSTLSAINMSFEMSWNGCIPIQTIYKELVDKTYVQIMFGTVYSIILICGLVANILTLYCLLSTSCQLGLNVRFLVSLGVADLFISVTSLPITAIQIFSRVWLWGVQLCRYVPLFQGASFFISSFTLTAIAVERYLIIARDTNKGESRRNLFIITAIWLFGIFASLPYALYMDLRKTCAENSTICLCGEFCEEQWPHETAKRAYGSSAFVAHFGLPLCVLAFCYWRVGRTVSTGVKRRLNKENLSLMSRQRLIRRKRRTNHITFLLILCFVAPWLPVNALNLLRDYLFLPDDHVSILYAVAHVLAMTSILWNPIIYCWYNKQFLDTFKSILRFRRVPWLTTYSSDNETYQAMDNPGTTNTPRTNCSRLISSSVRRHRSRLSTTSRRPRVSSMSVALMPRTETVGNNNNDKFRLGVDHSTVKKCLSADPKPNLIRYELSVQAEATDVSSEEVKSVF